MKKSLLALGLAATLATGATSTAAASSAHTDAARADQGASPLKSERFDETMVADGKWKLFDTSSDVDGDGHIDGVWLRKKSAKICQVKVTMGKRSVQRNLYGPWNNPCTYGGSALFDTRKGAEIKVMTGMGAHTPWDHIVTYRNGKLILQKAPDKPRWTVDATAMYAEGYKRIVNSQGQVRLVHDFVNRKRANVWKGNRKVLAFQGGKWVQTRKVHITRTDKQTNKLAGWRIRGFKRWM